MSNVVLGLYSPFRFGQENCEGYDIKKLRDNFRLLEVIVSRDGEMGGLCPLFFDGAVCSFTELPHPKLTAELTKVYKYAESIRIAPVKEFLMVTIRKAITRLQGWN